MKLAPALAVAWLWFRLLDTLWLEWTTNAQYSYGLIVPLLALGLLARRWHACRVDGELRSNSAAASPSVPVMLCLVILPALLYLPVRLIAGAVPEWRLIQWMLALITVAISLGTVRIWIGREAFRQAAFPVAFILVAVPWPTPLESPLIRSLTQSNASLVIEILGILGIPALQHGNLIEVATGTVGVDEACSGIRSFQSSVMISLFFGEYYRFNLQRRLLLLPTGFLLAFAFNVTRTTILTWIASKDGVDAIARYHDQAGLAILLACSSALWLTAWILNRRGACSSKPKDDNTDSRTERNLEPPGVGSHADTCVPEAKELPATISAVSPAVRRLPFLPFFACALLAWLVVVEVGVELWYHSREATLSVGPDWTIQFPTNYPTFKSWPVAPNTAGLLRFDEGRQAQWTEADGISWQGFYFEWLPGRTAGYLAKRHTPEACLPAAGFKLAAGPTLTVVRVHGLVLPIRCYAFRGGSGLIHVFQCRWEAGAGAAAYIEDETTRFNLLRGIWAGRGRRGQKVFEFITDSYLDPAQAREALVILLEKRLALNPSERSTSSL